MAGRKRKQRRSKKAQLEQKPMLFGSQNYIYLLAGILMIAVGYIGMYLESAKEGFYSLYITPLLVIGGFVVVVLAILKSEKNQPEESETIASQD